jgi:hypothetical protein
MARAKQPSVREVVRNMLIATGGDPSAHLDRAAIALEFAAEADTYARAEVMAARELDGASWADVGAALGMTRQAAHERFRTGPDGFHSRWYKLRSTTK